jgi:methionyl-tRNA formyltransferase
MKITVICSSPEHPIWPRLEAWVREKGESHDVRLVNHPQEIESGDLLLLISCTSIIKRDVRERFGATLVCHASDVPRGRGWSPLVWQVLEGANRICVTLMYAEDKVDSGKIWAQRTVELEGHELADEIYGRLFDAELELMDFAVEHFGRIEPRDQPDVEPTYYPRRRPEDSKVDVNQSLAEVFDLLRIADSNRYPVFFDHRGYRYSLSIQKVGPTPTDES